MRNTVHYGLCLALILCTLRPAQAVGYPIDVINSQQYQGNYIATQPTPTFNYLDGKEGSIIALFYGQPNRDIINSLTLILLDPRYADSKMVRVELKQVVDFGPGSEWANSSHQVTITTAYKQRVQDIYQLENVSTLIRFRNLESADYAAVELELSMKGLNFELGGKLTYYNQIVSTLAYSLYLSLMVGIQIYSAMWMLRIMDAPNFVFTAKLSLLTLSVCNIQDFSKTMSHIQLIMGNSSGYLFFIMPALAYLVLFIVFDMKMLFLVWRSNNLRNIDNPQLIRKKLTTFYIQFYLGLFVYLTLTYFFSNDEWMIIVRNLVLVPQIVHNIRLGNNPGFSSHYIFGYIGTRLFLPLYERLCPQNRFALTPNLPLAVILMSLFAVQVILLFLQSYLGSRFFVPKRFQPNYFDYKLRLLRDESTKELECSICLQNLFEQPQEGHSGNLNASELSLQQPLRKQVSIMNTPCNHKFHQQCLMQWMDVKLQCPSCRAQLPPV